MTKKIAVFLVLALLLTAMTACNGNTKKALQGSWTCTVDLGAAYEALLKEADPELTSHISIEAFQVDVTVRFESDGTYAVTANDAQLQDGAARMRAAIEQGLVTYLEMDTGMSIDDLMAVSGTSMDEIMETYFDADFTESIRDALTSQGTYEVEDEELIMTDDDDSTFFEGKFDVEDDTLKLKKGEATDLLSQLLPLKLTKE